MRLLVKKKVLIMCLLFFPFIVFAHDVTNADQELLKNGGLWAYIQVGATHMLTGFDHLLFLVGVIFYLKNLKDIIKFISVFTFGHCITLIGATYFGITANEHIVDAIIALSVLYKGIENLDFFKTINIKSPNLLVMIFLFGLIHGFGLSTRLQSFEIGKDQLLQKILCFNLGVELGQIIALIPVVLFIGYLRKQKQFTALYKAINWYLIIIGFALFCYQIYNYYMH